MQDINLKIRKIRNKKNLSQDRFGKKIGVSGKTISAYETGKIIPPLKILEEISKVYDENLIRLSKNKHEMITNNITNIEKILNEIKEIMY